MEDVLANGLSWLGMAPETQGKLLRSVLVVAVLLLFRSFVMRLIRRRVTDVAKRYRWSRGLTTAVGALIVVFLVSTWFSNLESLATFAGILGAGLAVAMHDTVANFAGYLFIAFRRPFEVGDRIEIDGTAGDVIDIRVLQFSMMEIGNWVDADQSTGRIMHVPNGKVLKERTASFTKGFEYIWHEVPVIVTFESDWRAAKAILEEIISAEASVVDEEVARQVRRAASRYLIYAGKMTPIVYTTVRDSGVLLTIRYLTKPKTRRGTEQRIWEEILDRFAKRDDIDLAYPTVRYYKTG